MVGLLLCTLIGQQTLGVCLLQFHGAIYSQSRALGSWRSDDIVTM
jgi:hypothetical protein